jgi:hypothetical protein
MVRVCLALWSFAACAIDTRSPTTDPLSDDEVDEVIPGGSPPMIVESETPSPGAEGEIPLEDISPPEREAASPVAVRGDAGLPRGLDAGASMTSVPVFAQSMDIALGTQSYVYECTSSVRGGISSREGEGPTFGTYSFSRNGCPSWPSANPDLNLLVYFAGFLRSEGRLPVGSFDMADSSTVENVRIQLIVTQATSVEELPVGAEVPIPLSVTYQSFDEDLMTQAFSQRPNLTGSVISRLRPMENQYEVELTSVILEPVPGEELGEFPPVIEVRHAIIIY